MPIAQHGNNHQFMNIQNAFIFFSSKSKKFISLSASGDGYFDQQQTHSGHFHVNSETLMKKEEKKNIEVSWKG